MAAANSSGGVMGKMIDAQSIVVASTATGLYGKEGEILRYVFFHSIALASLIGLAGDCPSLCAAIHQHGGRALTLQRKNHAHSDNIGQHYARVPQALLQNALRLGDCRPCWRES